MNRRGFLLKNTGKKNLYIKFGTGVTEDDYTYFIDNGDSLEFLFPYTGIVSIICDNRRGSTIKATEFLNGG